MDTITTSQVTDLKDPKLRKIALRIVREAELAMEKVAANHAEPSKFPLTSDPKSIETILASRFATLTAPTKQAAGIRAVQRINSPSSARSKRFGDLIAIDLTKATTVDAQAEALPLPADLKLSPNYLNSLRNLHGQVLVSPGLVPQATTDNLWLRIHSVKCVEETSDPGADEMFLGGTEIDESGDTRKISAFHVRDFHDGDEKMYDPPKKFTGFNLREGKEFPKSYFVTIVLAEKDWGGLADYLDDLLKWVKKTAVPLLTAAIGAEVLSAFGPLGSLIGATIGAIIGAIFDALSDIWHDDIFIPCTVSISVPGLNKRFAGGKTHSDGGLIRWRQHGGEYTLSYDWQMHT